MNEKNSIISIGTKKLKNDYLKFMQKVFEMKGIIVKEYHDVKLTSFGEYFKNYEMFSEMVSELLQSEFSCSDDIKNIILEK